MRTKEEYYEQVMERRKALPSATQKRIAVFN